MVASARKAVFLNENVNEVGFSCQKLNKEPSKQLNLEYVMLKNEWADNQPNIFVIYSSN